MVDSAEDRYLFGWMQISLISFTFVINMLMVMTFSLRSVKMVCVKVGRIGEKYLNILKDRIDEKFPSDHSEL